MREAKNSKVGGLEKAGLRKKKRYDHLTSTFCIAAKSFPAGGKLNTYGINSLEILHHFYPSMEKTKYVFMSQHIFNKINEC